jgi:hypothetical protein
MGAAFGVGTGVLAWAVALIREARITERANLDILKFLEPGRGVTQVKMRA